MLQHWVKLLFWKRFKKELEERIQTEGEIPEKVELFKKCADLLSDKHGTEVGVPDNDDKNVKALSVEEEIKSLKQKHNVEMSTLMDKLAQVKTKSSSATSRTTSNPFFRCEFRVKSVNPGKQINWHLFPWRTK